MVGLLDLREEHDNRTKSVTFESDYIYKYFNDTLTKKRKQALIIALFKVEQ